MKVCEYPVYQRKHLHSYLSHLVKKGYQQPSISGSWQGAPHFVAEEATKFRINIEERPVIAATMYETRPCQIWKRK